MQSVKSSVLESEYLINPNNRYIKVQDLWNAKIYSQFLDNRTKPALDLCYAIPHGFSPKSIVDLGCGPGNSTVLLKSRWPKAKVLGIDSSLDMLTTAQNKYPRITFLKGDIESFTTEQPIDCIFANASLQWVDKHEVLLPRLLSFLNLGGILAIQIPNNFHNASHQVIIEILQTPPWRALYKKIQQTLRYSKLSAPLYKIGDYYDIFSTAKVANLQLWETIYQHEMPNHQAIFTWLKGSGLRPILSEMSSLEQKNFESDYLKAIAPHYPPQKNSKILFPFHRVFMVAQI